MKEYQRDQVSWRVVKSLERSWATVLQILKKSENEHRKLILEVLKFYVSLEKLES